MTITGTYQEPSIHIVLCPIKVNSNTIDITVHPSRYSVYTYSVLLQIHMINKAYKIFNKKSKFNAVMLNKNLANHGNIIMLPELNIRTKNSNFNDEILKRQHSFLI